jgi:RNA polymerase sigma-70 factor (ECF subfamily)
VAFLKKISSGKTDAELMAAYRQSHDLEVLAELFQRYMDLVYGVCLKYLKQTEDAQDSTLAIFEELGPKLLKHEVAYFKAWLHMLTKNHCLMRLRSEKKQPTVKFDVELVQSEESLHLNGVLEREENFKQLEFCLSQLVNDQRRAIELFYLEGKCYNEITELTGIEWNKVRSYIQNGRRNLKICIETQKAKTLV